MVEWWMVGVTAFIAVFPLFGDADTQMRDMGFWFLVFTFMLFAIKVFN